MNPGTTFAIATAPKRNSRHWKLGTVTWAEMVGWLEKPGRVKEAGNYLLGTLRETTTAHDKSKPTVLCTGMHRRKQAVVSRSAITLDVDHPNKNFADDIELTFPYAAILHTTFSAEPDTPRYRLIIPTDREMAPDEYVYAARSLMQQLGSDQFDPSTDQPERYMFKPAAPEPSWFHSVVVDAPVAPVDQLISEFEVNLHDKPLPKPGRNKRNPFEIEGVIGFFNRAYEDWDQLIQEYELPYSKVDDERYQLIGATSQAGMGPVADAEGLVYSHHVSDPAYGRACSAFDLVRLHRFGELDEESNPQTPVTKLPSHGAMIELAAQDHRVLALQVGLDFDDLDMEAILNGDDPDPDDQPDVWKLRLRRASSNNKVHDEIRNWDLIRECHPIFKQLYFNEMTMSIEVEGDLPWREVTPDSRVLKDVDRIELGDHLDRELNFRTTNTRLDAMINVAAHRRIANPVRDYLETLVWDGKARVETCLPGVEPTKYTRLVARRCLVAAVARIFEPGVKWDHTLVLFGKEGLGKSTWVERLAKGYAATLGRIDDKDTLLTMQRSWIMMSDEGHSLRKSDVDALKEFITRTADVFRMPYDREVEIHKRHCVIWSTTNDETFLRREEGNRRYLIVHCEKPMDFEAFDEEYVDQIWAEAVHLYRAGEPLFLNKIESALAAVEREPYVEDDVVRGLVDEYLERLYPANWDEKSIDQRLFWLQSDQSFEPGVAKINQVCITQLFREEMGGRAADVRSAAAREIRKVLKNHPDWVELPNIVRHPQYGPQRVFERKNIESADSVFDDLL